MAKMELKQKKKIRDISPIDYSNNAMREYATYVMQDRAIACAFDGLKPVQRRILYASYCINSFPNKPHVKCARIVGETCGKYHPHGDQAAYQTLVNMVKAPYPLMHGHGNFGSETDPECAAMRYTEARLSPFGASMFEDLHVMPMVPNYDGKDVEPDILPAKVPVALVNGSEGIGVGLSANLPPHNITEIIEALQEVLKNPETELLFNIIKGPDYGVGICTSSKKDIRKLYEEGSGAIRYRCKYHYEVIEGENVLVITEFAPRFNYDKFVQRCQELEEQGAVTYVSNQSSHKTGLRICVGFKSPKLLKDRVLKLLHTSCSYQLNLLGPESKFSNYGVRGILLDFLDFRRDIEKKVLEHKLVDVRDKLLKEKAKYAAAINIDKLTAVLKMKLEETALVEKLVKELELENAEQAKFLLGCQIRTLTRINLAKTKETIKELKECIKALELDLKDIDAVVSRNLTELKEKFGAKRGMSMSKIEPRVAESVGSIYFGATRDGSFSKFTTFPKTNKQKFDFMCVTDDTVTVVTDNGNAQIIEAQAVNKGTLKTDKKTKVVGIVPSTATYLLVMDAKGMTLAIDNHRVGLKAGTQSYTSMNTEHKLVGVWGVDPDDQVIAWSKDYFSVHDGSKLKIKRKGSKGSRILSGRSSYNVIVVPSGCVLMTVEGRTINDFQELQKRNVKLADLFLVNKKGRNIVLIDDKKIQVSGMEMEVLLQKKTIQDIFPEV